MRKRTRTLRIILALLAFLCIYGTRALEAVARQNLEAFAEMQIGAMANQVITAALAESVGDVDPSKLVEVHRNSRDEVEFIQVNTLLISKVQALCTQAIQRGIERLGEYTVRIPLGQFLGSVVLASVGPVIPVRLMPLGSVAFSVRDKFEAVGINQTRLSFYGDVDVKVRVVVPLVSYDFNIASSVPLATVVVPGKVPASFLHFE
ncbi:MAG: sporulation protein YunB [Bacillota bacterium]